MCGIFGYIGNGNATKKVFAGLKQLEYRGYDSWGIAVVKDQKIHLEKHVGAIGEAKVGLSGGRVAIGHTRWATNGGVTQKNAHPHLASNRSFALAQNGIVENEAKLKNMLTKQGYEFVSETDTEVIVRLIEDEQKRHLDLQKAITSAFMRLKGRNTIIVLTNTGDIYAARRGSPFVVGLGDGEGEIYFSSDTLSFAGQVEKIIPLKNNELVAWKNNQLSFYSCVTGEEISKQVEPLAVILGDRSKGGFDTFMMKEIFESKDVIRRTIRDTRHLVKVIKLLSAKAMVYTIGSGTAGVAAAQIAYYLREHSRRKATSLVGAEAAEYLPLMDKGDAIIAISQSGETADVLETLEKAKARGVVIIAHINMRGSSMGRMADIEIVSGAGPEICVMSTKAFTAQIAWGYLLAHALVGEKDDVCQELEKVASEVERYLKEVRHLQAIKRLARKLTKSEHIFLLGKGQNLALVNEGMIKMIEGSYKHAHGMPAGDLKHYAITIIEKGIPVIILASDDDSWADTMNAASQVSARHGTVIGIAPRRDASFEEYIEVPNLGTASAICNVIVLQLLAYYMAVALGNNVDKPRNIAKSVTVK